MECQNTKNFRNQRLKVFAINHKEKCQEILQSITMSAQHLGINYGKRPTLENSVQKTLCCQIKLFFNINYNNCLINPFLKIFNS